MRPIFHGKKREGGREGEKEEGGRKGENDTLKNSPAP